MESNPDEGDDTEPQPKAQAEPKKMMKRPAAAPKASTKKRKGSADAGGEGTAVLEVEMAAPSKDGLETAVVPSGLSGEDQKANEAAETGDEKSHGKPKAKAKGKGRAKAKANVTPCGSPGEASDGEASDGNCTVHFDTNPLHAGFYKGPEDVPFPPSSPEHAEPDTDGAPAGRGRGRGRGRKGGGRGGARGAADVPSASAAGKPKGKGKGKAYRIPIVPADGEDEVKTFARRRMPSARMNQMRFLAIRDAFDTIIRHEVPKFPSKQEDLSMDL